jgi:hypothetical protein
VGLIAIVVVGIGYLAYDQFLRGDEVAPLSPGSARLADGRTEVVGSLTFPFSDFAIQPPNIAGLVSVESEGTLEFLPVFEKG